VLIAQVANQVRFSPKIASLLEQQLRSEKDSAKQNEIREVLRLAKQTRSR